MFRRTLAVAARSPYSVFLVQVQQKNNPALKGLTIAKRGKAISKLWKGLSKSELAKIKATAAKLPAYKKVTRAEKKAAWRAALKLRKLSAYHFFVRANIKKQPGKTYVQKMKNVAKLWNKTKKLSKSVLKH